MKSNIENLEIAAKVPEIPHSMPVFQVKSPSLDERRKAIEIFSSRLQLGKSYTADAQDSLLFISQQGVIQFYRPSGALWVRNIKADADFKDEIRLWKTEKIADEDDNKDFKLVLKKEECDALILEARSLFTEAELLGKETRYADVELDEITQFDEKGNEIGNYPGKATVRFLYELESIKVDGPEAKTYAYCNPGEITGAYHAWREPIRSYAVEMLTIERAINMIIDKDGELSLCHKRKQRIKLTEITLVYYALPPFKYQEYVFPALQIVGSVYTEGKRGFEFARYFHVATAEAYAKADLYADYLTTRL